MRAKGSKHACATDRHLADTAHTFKKMLRSDATIDQRFRCIYCCEQMTLKSTTAEHLIAKSRGGALDRKNIKGACEPCNKAKGSGNASWFRRVLHQREIPLDDPLLTAAFIRFRLNRRLQRAEKRICAYVGMAA